MRTVWRSSAIVALAVLSLLVFAVACGGGSDSAPTGAIEGRLPPEFPDDFPMYPGLRIVRSSPLGERYVIETRSDDPVDDIADFYKEELTKGRWDLLGTEDAARPKSVTLRFTAPGFPLEGKVFVAESLDKKDKTAVGIAMPMDTGDGG